MFTLNRLGKDHIIIINASFYRNIFLLKQVIQPSFEFQQHFKKNMFNKPNAAGFLHVSHYLSVIYDVKLFKQMVNWPLLCKKDEIIYRCEIKNFLSVLSRDNPDINFPTILASHLNEAGGTKFLIIMWKLSQLALRAYIKKQLQEELLSTPHTSLANELTVAYFNNVIAEKCKIIRETHGEAKRILDTASNFLKSEIELHNMYKAEIFQRIQNITRQVVDLSVHPLVQEQLMDIENPNIINRWKKNISKNLQSVHSRNQKLNELRECGNHLCKLVSTIISNSEILNANELPHINCDNYLLRTQNLYTNGSIAFSTLIWLVSLASTRMLQHINIANALDLSQYSQHVEEISKNMKVLRALFRALNIKVTGIHLDEQRISQKTTTLPVSLDTKDTVIMYRNILSKSEFNFDLDQRINDDEFHKTLCPSPIKDKYKQLFRKHKRKCYQRKWCTASQTFSNSTRSNINRWLSPCGYSFKSKPVTPDRKPTSPLPTQPIHYSKLPFTSSTGDQPHSPKSTYEQSTSPRKRSISRHQITSRLFKRKARNLFNSPTTSSLYISQATNLKSSRHSQY